MKLKATQDGTSETRAPEPRSYDPVAEEYARRYNDELEHKPFDRERLDFFGTLVRPGGLVADLGCGPGHLARYLADRGHSVQGYDLSEGMLREARRLHPAIRFEQLDFTNLHIPDGTWAGIVAGYALIHLDPETLSSCLLRLVRALEPRGPILASFHLGNRHERIETIWETPVCLNFHFYESAQLQQLFRAAGFNVLDVRERDPYPDVEYQGRRSYILARGAL